VTIIQPEPQKGKVSLSSNLLIKYINNKTDYYYLIFPEKVIIILRYFVGDGVPRKPPWQG